VSDIDLLVATASDIDDKEFSELQQMHNDFVDKHPSWNDRIEIAYLSVTALQTFKSQMSQIGLISPGEPFQLKEAGKHYLLNWYVVQEKGKTLFGPSPKIVIDPISKEEFIQVVQEHVQEWTGWVYEMHHRKAQAYAILTMCRALYACHYGEQVSKRQAALWAQQELPQWASLIQNALLWRVAKEDETVDHEATFPETLQFVQFMVARIGAY
jgi:hypothetical protein